MPMADRDPLVAELAALATAAPEGLLERIAARGVRIPGPIGDLYVASTDRGIAYVQAAEAVGDSAAGFAEAFRARFARPLLAVDRPPLGLLPALRTGRATDLRFDLREATAFEEAVLRATLAIPRGEVRPYGWVAAQIGRPGAVRAVGSALGRNPVPVLIPCHRVVRADGVIGEYLFGRSAKRRLLEAEGANVDEVGDLARRGVRLVGSDTTGVVCLPACAHARRITGAYRRGFHTVAEAVAAGYRPCRHCRPVWAGEG